MIGIGERQALLDVMPFAEGLINIADTAKVDGKKYCTPLSLRENKALAMQYANNDILAERKAKYERVTGKEFVGIDYKFPCVSDSDIKAETAFTEGLKATERERNRNECFEYPAMKKYTFSADDGKTPELTQIAKEYAEYFDSTMQPNGIGALMVGGVGTGKTFLACCIANELIDRGKRCKFTTIADLTAELEDFSRKREVLKELARYDFVILDDLGTERRNSYMAERAFTIVDTLYKANVPFCVTTNFALSSMSNDDDINRKRLYDRIKEKCAVVIRFEIESRRTALGKENHKAAIKCSK